MAWVQPGLKHSFFWPEGGRPGGWRPPEGTGSRATTSGQVVEAWYFFLGGGGRFRSWEEQPAEISEGGGFIFFGVGAIFVVIGSSKIPELID